MPTPRVTRDVSPAALAVYDAVIDVRSPGEYALDHVPGAINLPVLDDAERAEVGRIYVQQSPFLARRIGAAHVARNIARHLETRLASAPAGFRPLVYCWRGGQRSQSMAVILGQVGWPVSVLEGGYRTYRKWVTQALYEGRLDHRLILLDGPTGSAKTDILAELAAEGSQVLDLEGLAGHRGSLFGAFAGRPQPGQKLFETRLAQALAALDPTRPVVVEAESSKIGEIILPPALWEAMRTAPVIRLEAGAPSRAAYLVSRYSDLLEDPASIEEKLARLPRAPSQARLGEWVALVRAGQYETLVQALMAHHYDPAYSGSSRRSERPLAGVVALDPSSPAQRARAARAVAGLVEAWMARQG